MKTFRSRRPWDLRHCYVCGRNLEVIDRDEAGYAVVKGARRSYEGYNVSLCSDHCTSRFEIEFAKIDEEPTPG